MSMKQKYIITCTNEVVIFADSIQHKEFKHLKPVAAGFCVINPDKKIVLCFGESISLDLKSREIDATCATKLLFGPF